MSETFSGRTTTFSQQPSNQSSSCGGARGGAGVIGNERIERGGSLGEGLVEHAPVHCTERLGGLLKCYRRAA